MRMYTLLHRFSNLVEERADVANALLCVPNLNALRNGHVLNASSCAGIMVLLTEIVPNFKANTTLGPIDFHDYIEGSWAVSTKQSRSTIVIRLS